MEDVKELYLLTHDWVMNLRSVKESTRAVVTSKEEAKRWIKDREDEYGYEKLKVFSNIDDALKWINGK